MNAGVQIARSFVRSPQSLPVASGPLPSLVDIIALPSLLDRQCALSFETILEFRHSLGPLGTNICHQHSKVAQIFRAVYRLFAAAPEGIVFVFVFCRRPLQDFPSLICPVQMTSITHDSNPHA
jgi:hypothetical protein